MPMRPPVLCALLPLLLAAPAAAGPSLTIYAHDLAFVREARTLDVRAGRDTLRLEGVSDRLDPTSVRLAVEGARVVRLAYRWDVATGDDLLARSLGRRLRVVAQGERVSEGTLLSAAGAWLVVRGDDGAVTALARDRVQEVQVARPDAGLSLRPAIEAVLAGARGGPLPAQLAYLTGGLSWTAEHTLVRTGETSARWSTAVQIENATGRAFADAKVRLVAGEPARAGGPEPRPLAYLQVSAARSMEAPDAKAAEEGFADYHLYTLAEPLTLRDRETQTWTLYDPRPVSVKPRYVYRGGDPRGVLSRLELVNSAGAGPGVPLPAGRVRCFAPAADDELQFVGESMLRPTAVDEPFTLDLGYAFDLAAERHETSNRRIADHEREYAVEIRLRNRRAADASVQVEEPAGGDVEVVQSSLPATRKDANTLAFTVPVPAGREVVLTYTARQRF